MSHEQEDYQKHNGAKTAGKVAKYGAQKAKKALGNVAKKTVKKLAGAVLKKIGKGILLKTAPIWGSILAVLLISLIVVAMFVPDISAEKANGYDRLSTELGISTKLLLAFDTVLHENNDLDKQNPNESAYYFIRLIYEEYEPARTECGKYDSTDKTKCIETKNIPEKVTKHIELQGKESIKNFFRARGLPLNDIPIALDGLRSRENTRVTVTTLPLEIAVEQAKFTEEQKEYLDEMIASGLIDEEFPNLGFSFGIGASCAPDKELNMSAYSSAFSNAGVFRGYEKTFISIAEKNGIDPVIMAAIAFHETGFGTSNAVKNKNNPGGLMNPDGSGLFRFSTLTEGLESLGRTLHNRIIKDGKSTIEQLGSVYAPVGAANDPTGLNNHWVPNITKIVQNLGGLTMNCEVAGMPNLDGITDETVKAITTSGFRWINNSIYVFGGGRSSSDIAKGWFDCSSFVHWAFAQGGVNLGPLTSVSTETLNKIGRPISISEMQPGDLIFWDTYKRDGHVGIYIGNGKFIGSQSSSGVAVVDVNNSYWKSVFSGHVRRILN